MSRTICTKAAITPGQIWAARGLLGWTREVLADKSALSMRTLATIEGGGPTTTETLERIRVTLEKGGIKFIKPNGGGPGVRLRKRTAE
jgi:transcriptional regulator with XRE-family HTH domain